MFRDWLSCMLLSSVCVKWGSSAFVANSNACIHLKIFRRYCLLLYLYVIFIILSYSRIHLLSYDCILIYKNENISKQLLYDVLLFVLLRRRLQIITFSRMMHLECSYAILRVQWVLVGQFCTFSDNEALHGCCCHGHDLHFWFEWIQNKVDVQCEPSSSPRLAGLRFQ